MTSLQELAAAYAIQPEYHGIDGDYHRVPEATLSKLLAAFGVAAGDARARAASLAAAPARPAAELRAPEGKVCHLPERLERERAWGLALQLYGLRSARNWGIGDFADLEAVARIAGAAGADFIGLNPLHAPLLADPARRSPFSPSNRRFLNPLYIAVDDLPLFDMAWVPARDLAAVRESALVDYPAVAALKLAARRRLWRTARGDIEEFAKFRAGGGLALERHATFEAISARMVAEGRGAGWPTWSEEWRDPESRTVKDFAARSEEVGFHAWLQWIADRQLGEARDAALHAGMRTGLYLDFAVGELPDGSSAWSDRSVTLAGVHVGAPPDYFSASGQDWRLAPLSPAAVATSGAAPFRALMHDATRRAGALRIDHAMALWQLFMIPEGAQPVEGAYVRFPIEDMIAALAETSQAHRTIIIGEDLGNVPPGFREVMEAARILSYRILLFERDERGFIPPERYPRHALVCLSTHDLPTLQGWWRGDDVALRERHGLISPEMAAQQAAAREGERADLLRDLAAAGLAGDATPDLDAAPDALVVAAHRRLAQAPSLLFAVRIEDAAGEREPANLPGTIDEYPNWRRKLGVTIEDLEGLPLWRAIAEALRAERPRQGR